MTGEDIGNSSSSSSHPTTAVTHLHRDINRRIVDANSVTKVLNIVEANSQDFNAVNISTAFHRLARMWRDLPDLNASSNGQTRLDGALQTLMRLAVRHIKQVGTIVACSYHTQGMLLPWYCCMALLELSFQIKQASCHFE